MRARCRRRRCHRHRHELVPCPDARARRCRRRVRIGRRSRRAGRRLLGAWLRRDSAERTAFVGHVGTDPWGQLVRTTLADDGVDTTAVLEDPAGTARSVNLIDSGGRRRAYYDARGAGTFVPDLDVSAAVVARVGRRRWSTSRTGTRQLLPVARAGREHGRRRPPRLPRSRRSVSGRLHRQRRRAVRAPGRVPPSNLGLAGRGIAGALARPGRRGRCRRGRCGTGDAATGAMSGPHAPATTDNLPVVDTNGAGDALAVGFCDAFRPRRARRTHGAAARSAGGAVDLPASGPAATR